MTSKKKLHLIPLALLVLFFLIFGSYVASAGTETQLVHGQRLVQGTAIYGNIVTWSESAGNGVHVYDLTAGKEIGILGYTSGDIPVYGNKIVWVDIDENVKMYDLSTGEEAQITPIDSGASTLDIYGDNVAYTKHDYSNGSSRTGYYYRLYFYNLVTHKETQITTSDYGIRDPAMYGNKIVWLEYENNSKRNIYIYDIPTQRIGSISTSGTAKFYPDIYGNIVVWWETHNGKSDIYMRDIAAHTTTQITTSGTASYPSIYGNRIVWQSTYYVDDKWLSDIYMYDISTSKTTRITNSTKAFSPSIYGDKIVYADSRNHLDYPGSEVSDIYLYDLSSTAQNPPVAAFTADVTSGTAPLIVKFTDTSTGGVPTSWLWDTGDGFYSKHATNATHTFTGPGVYNVTLTVANEAGNSTVMKQCYIIVTSPQAPMVDFYTNLTTGTAPLTVLFVDTSKVELPTSWYWDFGDGTNSNDWAATVHTFTKPGNYTISLTVENAVGNNTTTKPGYIVVTDPNDSSGGSSSGSSHSSSGSSGGAGGFPEPAKNVEVKELSQAFITNGKTVKFDFAKNATCVAYVSFDPKKTFGKTTTIAEMLKGKSTLVPELPSGETYKSFNIWVGNIGVATSKNIENPVVCFRVEKAWIKDKKIKQDSITLNRYNDKKWEQSTVNLSGEDNKFLYFTAKTSGFSSFAITGTEKPSEETVTKVEVDYPETVNNTASKEPQTEQKEISSIPGFEIYYGIASLVAVLLYKRK